MESQYLKTLCTVMETGSFSRAANELNITQSAVSQRIKFLEEFYGAPLLDRAGTVLTLSEPGTLVYNNAKKILALENELKDDLRNLGKKSHLSLCCTPTFGIVYLPKVLNHFFMINSTDVDLKFIFNTPALSLQGVLNKDFDLAIIEHCTELDLHEGTSIKLPSDELIFIAAPSLNLSDTTVPLDELMNHCLIARRDGCSSRCLLEENLARTGNNIESFKGTIIYDDLHLTIQSVLAGRGIAFVSRSLVIEQLQKGDLKEHRVSGFSCFRMRSAVLLKKRADDAFIKSFVDCVFKAFTDPDLTEGTSVVHVK